MALEVSNVKREFTFKRDGKDIPLTDPNPEFSVEEVLKFHSAFFPELTNGMVEGPKVVGDKASYTVSTKAGKLG
jgi:PRTRC genetic system protein C